MPDVEVTAPIPVGDPATEYALQVAEKCLEIIETYRKGSRTALCRVAAIQGITTLLTSGTDELTETEINDALGSYLRILKWHSNV